MPRSNSSGSTLVPSAGRRGSVFARASVDIRLDGHYQARVYTTGDSIAGTVHIAATRDLALDAVEIVLLGTAHTRVDTVGGGATSSHILLKMVMPPPAVPVPRLVKAGGSLALPLHFVVPAHLTLGACHHDVTADAVRDHHVCLPPTMGDNGSATWERDDLAPTMARVAYVVRARVLCAGDGSPRRGSSISIGSSSTPPLSVVAEAALPVRILPASLAPPPADYTTTATATTTTPTPYTTAKSLRKGLLTPLLRSAGSRLGCVRASLTAPLEPVVLAAHGRAASPTAAAIRLLFDPVAANVPPPRVTAVAAKLVAHTYFSLGAIASLPTPAAWKRPEGNDALLLRSGSYSASVALLARALGPDDIVWQSHITSGRRDSGYCSDGSDGARRRASVPDGSDSTSTSTSTIGIAHDTDLLVPLALPVERKTFLPTFHSCILSRTYSLQLSVSVVPGSSSSSSGSSGSTSSGSSTTLTLTVPLHIAVADDGAVRLDGDGLPSFDTAVAEAEAEADAHLLPRTLAVPDAEYQQTSLLPGYGGW